MGKKTVATVGTIQIKIDTKDEDYRDMKEPHVSFVRNGVVLVNHLMLSEVDHLVGRDSDEKKAIYWVREKKEKLIEMYNQ